MARTVGAYEAKTHLAALLDRVERGERITITRHGRAVAVLLPPADLPGRTAQEAVTGLLELRRGRRLREEGAAGPGVRDLIEEGRR
ncbi:MAG: type II toxin-antitoxin system Phd/YefM family antitoxin [Gemmatimonadetes bacterium]|nr:type II toxin-antitoxin system Phd/YefM family antitoxin [Gemmatimonadota bacterium]